MRNSHRTASPTVPKALIGLMGLVVVFGISSRRQERRQAAQESQSIQFVQATREAGLQYAHGYRQGADTDARQAIGGVAAGDVDGDQLVDLFLVRGNIGPNLLFLNQGDGTFVEAGEAAGLDLRDTTGSGPMLADLVGNGRLDLVIGGIEDTKPMMFRNDGDFFVDTTVESGLEARGDTISAAAADYDRDGDLDLFLSHWMGAQPTNPGDAHLWRNLGDGAFEPLSDEQIGLSAYQEKDFSFAPNFTDLDGDGWSDLVVTGDFGTSRIFLNTREGTFLDITDATIISDENGMGAAVGDYDNDGDLDWFVSSIWDPVGDGGWGVTGNRLYRNRGDGTFDDVTSQAGVREGDWGWAGCFEDFNNDGHLDLFHVNGFVPLPGQRDESDKPGQRFLDDPSRLFVSNGNGTFSERSQEAGLDDRGQGRGVVCFDYDRDGDVDLFVANNSGDHQLYRNDGGNRNNWLTIRLFGDPPNTRGIGARVYLTLDGMTQLRETKAGSNYVSQQPDEIYFGLGQYQQVDRLTVVWPDGQIEHWKGLAVNQVLILRQGHAPFSPAGWSSR